MRRREGGGAAAPEHKNNEARGAMGPSRLVPESLSDLDRCHSWAPGEEPPPQCCQTAPPTRHLPQAGPTEVQAGPSHRQPPHQVGAGRPQGATQSGRGVGWGYGGKRVGAGPLQGTGGGNWGLLGAPWPSGAAMCVRDTQSMLLCLYSYEAEGVCAREAKCECGCDGDEARTWVHASLGSLITPLCPSRATAVLVGASHAGARGGRV